MLTLNMGRFAKRTKALSYFVHKADISLPQLITEKVYNFIRIIKVIGAFLVPGKEDLNIVCGCNRVLIGISTEINYSSFALYTLRKSAIS